MLHYHKNTYFNIKFVVCSLLCNGMESKAITAPDSQQRNPLPQSLFTSTTGNKESKKTLRKCFLYMHSR